MKFLQSENQPPVTGASVLGLALIMCASIGSYTAYAIKASQDVIEVTGSAKVVVVSDFARWTISLETKTGTSNQTDGYTRLEAATEKIVAYLNEQGYEDIETPAPSIYPNYTYPQYGEPVMTGYTVSRQIVVRSEDVAGIQALAGSIGPLSGSGYTVSTGQVELTYQQLPETRVTLLTEAITDATARAEAIAKESGREVDTLRSASSGVVQVLPAGGVEVSDYGMYDTQSMDKEVMVTVRAKFSIK
jgi:hypothetical protein